MARRKNIDTSSAVFTDFSKGLYLLDTPRGFGDQLASLGLSGGRNIWSEKGALVPQYGYEIKAKIPNNEKVLVISDDDQASSSIFIVTQDIETNKGNVYLYTASQGLRKYKTQIPSIAEPIITARTGNNLIITTAGVNYEFGAYYPESPEELITDELDIRTYSTYYEVTIPQEDIDYYWNGKEIYIKSGEKIVPAKVVSMVKTNAATNKNVVTAKEILEAISEGDTIKFTGSFDITRVGTQSYCPLFGTSGTGSGTLYNVKVGYGYFFNYPSTSFYIGAETYSDNSDARSGYEFQKINPEVASYNFKLELNSKNAYLAIYKGEEFLDNQVLDIKPYLEWLGTYPDREVADNVEVYKNNNIISETVVEQMILRLATLQGTAHQTLTGNVSLNERTINTLTFKYIPEEPTTSNPEKVITPDVMGFCANRLCISDVSGTIYYSGVGVVDNFQEILGAGYFEGFADDNSKCLALEDYYNGVLITKQNGLYFLAFGIDSTSSVSASSSIGISIKKIAQIGQEYAQDHVIIDKQIIAYDSNSASILVAAAVNVFGSLVAGKTLVTAEELNAQNFGIPEVKRSLVYNSEAQVLILYYGEQFRNGIVYVPQAKSIFPREMDVVTEYFQGFNQGVVGVTSEGLVIQDFKKGTLIEGLSALATFEPISLRDNKIICASLLEISEMNGIEYDLTTTNTQTSLQHITPASTQASTNKSLPPMVYSDESANLIYNSFAMERKWADKMSSVTRVYAPMSGRYGINITMEFPKSESFCLVALGLPDFSKGE